MTPEPGKDSDDQSSNLMVALAEREGTVFIRIAGRATCESSKNLKDLFAQLLQRGYHQFVLDLTNCLIMDSTILGLVAGLGVKLAYNTGTDQIRGVRLLNPNQRITDLLDNLGVTQFFNIISQPITHTSLYKPVPQSRLPATREEIAQTSLDAHKLLMELNPDNVPKFKDVARFLAEDLERLQARKKPNHER
jgi:anti-anti-sigma factor